MKRVLLVAALMLLIAGCSMGSHVEVGPAYVSSSVTAHEWKDPAFVCEETDEGKGFVVGSTLGFLSSEVRGKVQDCNGMSIGAFVTWDQSEGDG